MLIFRGVSWQTSKNPTVLWFRGSTREAPVGGLDRIVSSKVLMCSLFDLLFEVLGATLALNLEVKNDQLFKQLHLQMELQVSALFFLKNNSGPRKKKP